MFDINLITKYKHPNLESIFFKVVVNGYFRPELETGIESEEEFLYDPSLVRVLDFSDSKVKFEPKISPASPGQDLLVRPLGSKDFGRGQTDRQKINIFLKFHFNIQFADIECA